MAKYRIETDKGTYEVETEDAPAPEQPSATSRFLGKVYESTIGPAVDMVTHPRETVLNLAGSAVDAVRNPGQTLKRLAGTVAGSAGVPVPVEILENDMPSAAGKAVGTVLSVAGPELLKNARVPITPKITNPNPAETAALGYLESKGVPVSGAAKTGSGYVKGLQKAVDSTPIGAAVSQKAQTATTKALQAEAGSLASRANPAPVVPEQAGAGVRSSLTSRAAKFAAEADAAYGDFRLMEQQTPMQVDVLPIKAQLRPIFEDMSKWMEPAKRNASAGFQAIKSIIEGEDVIPASQAEAGLGGLRQLAREGAGRNAGLGKYAGAQLQNAIDSAVGAADPGALAKLKQGRSATAAQYGTKAILDDIRQEPVQAFGQMTYAKDAGVDLLRKVNREAPGEMAKVGRAWLEDLFGKAQSQGGFQNADSLFAKWRDLGPETKQILFRDRELVSDLDKFFLGAKKLAENPNPSGSAVVGIIASSGGLMVTNPATGVPLVLGAGAVSKLLHSTAGVRALTQGMKVPLRTPAAAMAAGQILKLAGPDVQPLAQNSPSERTGLSASAIR